MIVAFSLQPQQAEENGAHRTEHKTDGEELKYG